MTVNVPHAYAVHLLYESAPMLDKRDLLACLRKYCGNVDPLASPEESDLLAFVHRDHIVYGVIPAQCLICATDVPPTLESLELSLHQSWMWREARNVVSGCHAGLVVTDVMAGELDYKIRLQLFHNVVLSVLELAPCLAIHWLPSQQVINPALYLDARQHTPHNSLDLAVNVRLFNIQDRKGEMLMDSMGLATLGIPDVQCHFTGLHPNDVAQVLYGAAYYLYEHGDVINNGETFDGITPDQHWKCQHEMALQAPEREVLDLNPGKPYAAGNRG